MKKSAALFLMVLCCIPSFAQDWQTMTDVPVDLTFPVVVELDGHIHVIGGGTGQGATGYHARYMPETNSWDVLAPVPYLAQQPAGAVVNGVIHYCGGGYPNSGTPLNDHYYYDAWSNSWIQAADLPTARVIHEAVGLDGKLYVLTGQPDKQRFDVYDPGTDEWTQLNDLPDLNFWYGVIVANDETIYRFGGGGYLNPQSSAYKYDKVNDVWIPLPDLPMALHASAGALITNTLICITGGYNTVDQDGVWLFNTITEEYEALDPLPVARTYHSAVVAQDCLYLVGGTNFNDETIGVNLIQNCAIVATGIAETAGTERPYELNASSTQFHVDINPSASSLPSGVQVFDGTGKLVWSERISSATGSLILSADQFSPGLYIVNLVIGDTPYTETWLAGN